MRMILLFLTFLLFPLFAFAGIESVWPVLGPVLLGYANDYPVIFTIVIYMGSARLIMKPLMSVALAYVNMTPTKKDDIWLTKLKTYWWYKSLVYLMDWSLSVKLPAKK